MAASLQAKESAKQLYNLIEEQKKQQYGLASNGKNLNSTENLDEIVRIRPSESMERLVTKQDSNLIDKYHSAAETRLY